MFVKYLCACLSIILLAFLMACWICFWYFSVGSLFINCMLISLINSSIFFFSLGANNVTSVTAYVILY